MPDRGSIRPADDSPDAPILTRKVINDLLTIKPKKRDIFDPHVCRISFRSSDRVEVVEYVVTLRLRPSRDELEARARKSLRLGKKKWIVESHTIYRLGV